MRAATSFVLPVFIIAKNVQMELLVILVMELKTE